MHLNGACRGWCLNIYCEDHDSKQSQLLYLGIGLIAICISRTFVLSCSSIKSRFSLIVNYFSLVLYFNLCYDNFINHKAGSTMNDKVLGKNIVELRKEKGVSQKQLAEMIHMSPQGLLQIEKGMVNPRAETIEKIIKALDISPNQLYGGSQFHQINIQLPIARNLRRLREDAELSIQDFADRLKITPDELHDLEKGKMIPSRELMAEFCKVLNIPKSELTKADDFSRSSEEVELLELVENRIFVVNSTLSILNKHNPIARQIYDPETGKETLEIITPYDQAKETLLHEFQKMTLDELLDLYRHFADGKISLFLDTMRDSIF